MSDPFELFFKLIDTLKPVGIHVTAAAREIGLNPVTVRSWRSRGGGPVTKEHVEKLIQAFPEQLKEKAEELGILTAPLITPEERLEQLLAVAQQKIAELELQLEQLQDKSNEEQEALQQRINTLLRTLDQLTKE